MTSLPTKAIMIAGVHSGSGKTAATSAILCALKAKGLTAQAFKVGPDYIDPAFHTKISGNRSYNLDSWMMGEERIKRTFYRVLVQTQAQYAVVEGVMGLFDGKADGKTEQNRVFYGSSAHIALILKIPVILLVDARSMAQSAGAVVYGFIRYVEELNIVGVIFNHVGSERHYASLKAGLLDNETLSLGYIQRSEALKIPERHLGLVSPHEYFTRPNYCEDLLNHVQRHVRMDRLIDLAERVRYYESPLFSISAKTKSYTIGVAWDEAFWFYYQENLDALSDAGLEIVFFSPLHDRQLPSAIDALYLGGGYPELYAAQLASNVSMLNAIHDFAMDNRVIYAECGGFMVLTEGLYTDNREFFPMARVFKTQTQMKKSRASLGYREVKILRDTPLGATGQTLRGHEFHYSELTREPENAIEIYQNSMNAKGYCVKSTFASYVHIHFASNNGIGDSFFSFIQKNKSGL